MQKVGLYALLGKIGIFRLLPLQLRKMEQMLPASGALWPRQLPEFVAGARMKEKREREPDAIVAKSIGFFAGCIGAVMFEDVNRMAVELLAAGGLDVIAPPQQVCCGAIHHHNGAHPD